MVRLIVGLVTGLAMVVGVMASSARAQDGDDLRIVTIRDTNLYAEARWDAEVLAVIPAGTVLAYQHNVSDTGFMTMSYNGYDGWLPLDSFVSYADYFGQDEGTGDVEALPETGTGPGIPAPTNWPLLGLAGLGLLVAAGLGVKTR
jgi:hypothetical protein